MVDEFEYQLKKPIEISDGGAGGSGGMITVNSITLIAPSARNSKAATGLQRMVNQSLSASRTDKEPTAEDKKKAEEEAQKNKDKPIRERFPAKDVINILAASNLAGNTLEDANGFLFSLLSNGCAKMNDKPAKQGDLDKLGLYDLQNILGEYVANFLSSFLFE